MPVEDWTPYRDQLQFEFADFLFRRNEMAQAQMDHLFDLMTALCRKLDPDTEPPFANHQDLLDTIDATQCTVPSWDKFTIKYVGSLPEHGEPPSWMMQEYVIWYRDAAKTIEAMLKNPAFEGKIDFGPYRDYDSDGNRQYKNFMSGDWAWKQAVSVYFRPSCNNEVIIF